MVTGRQKSSGNFKGGVLLQVANPLAAGSSRPSVVGRRVPFANGPKRPMGHFLGAEKRSFLFRGDDAAMVHGGRASGNLSIRGPEVSLGSFRVVTIHG